MGGWYWWLLVGSMLMLCIQLRDVAVPPVTATKAAGNVDYP